MKNFTESVVEQAAHGFLLGLAKLRSLVAAIGEELAQERVQTEQSLEGATCDHASSVR